MTGTALTNRQGAQQTLGDAIDVHAPDTLWQLFRVYSATAVTEREDRAE